MTIPITYNQVPGVTFIRNKYEDIDGGRVNQDTPRGRFCFRDTNGRYTLPRDLTEAKLAVYPIEAAMPLNPPPYYLGLGLNGQPPNPFGDGSENSQENTFAIDPDVNFGTWPVAFVRYDLPLHLYNLPTASGNKCLIFDEGTFTFGSGNISGLASQFNYGSKVYVDYTSGNEGKITASGVVAGNTMVGTVRDKDVFGQNTITVKLKGTEAL